MYNTLCALFWFVVGALTCHGVSGMIAYFWPAHDAGAAFRPTAFRVIYRSGIWSLEGHDEAGHYSILHATVNESDAQAWCKMYGCRVERV